MPAVEHFSKTVIIRAADLMKERRGEEKYGPRPYRTPSRERLVEALNEAAKRTLTRAR